MDLNDLERLQAGKRAEAAAFIAGNISGREMVHVKSGGKYTIITCAAHESDGTVLVVYKGEDGKHWARHQSEFFDGRFVQVGPAS